MSLLVLGLSAGGSRRGRLLPVFAFFLCTQFSQFVISQTVPATPTPQPVPPTSVPELVHLKDYSKPRPSLPNILQPYRAQELPASQMANSPRIDSLMRNGKIYLSIDDAVAYTLTGALPAPGTVCPQNGTPFP